jgi:hypothetical protein
MAVSVALLWACLIGEQFILRRAYLEQSRALYRLQQLRRQRQAEPVSTPFPHIARPLHPAAG